MKLKIASGRLNYEPRFEYQDGVLIGSNWYEDRLRYIREIHKHESEYAAEYYKKGPCFVHPNLFWNNKLAAEGLGPRLMMDHEGTKYHENFSTTYDVSYNILPKVPASRKLKVFSTRLHMFLPQQDYAVNFGNATKYGLKQRKKHQWEYELQTATEFYTTEIRDNYVAPKISDYCTKRKAVPRELSSILLPANLENVNCPYRGRLISLVPDIPIDVIPRMYPHFYF